MNRKGISKIIVTILFILLAVVAAIILWVIVSNIISKEVEISKAQSKLLNERVNFKKIQFDPNNNLSVSIIIQKSTGSSKLESVEEIIIPPTEVDVVSVVDISGSMLACHRILPSNISSSCCNNILNGSIGFMGNCYGISSQEINDCTSQCGGTLVDGLTPTQDANKQLVDNLFKKEGDNNQLGLVAYNETVRLSSSSNLTEDNVALKNVINSWEAGGGTCICCGINEAINKLSSSPNDREKTIIVMSDGETNRECVEQGTGDANQDAINASCDAYNTLANLTIYTVSLGDVVNALMMESIAIECGDGKNFSAYNVNELISVYEAIANQIIKSYESKHRFNYLKIVFYDGSSSVYRNIEIPDILETKNYDFDLSNGSIKSPITKIEIYPVILTNSGKEIIGPVLDRWERG